ncbi:MAG: PIN domain-containing protein [Betaproteobacteria bacterium]|nr:PIN domain-containing protein [Betaproteobacteria bacterium]
MILFFDACAVIYQVELAEPYYRRLKTLIARTLKSHPDARIAVSRLSWMECRVEPLRAGDTQRLQRFDEFFGLDGLLIVEINADVIETATRLRAATGLKAADAIQAGCALALPGPTLFVTNNAAFDRVPGLDVLLVD